MKKRFKVIAAILAAVTLLTGCAAAGNHKAPENTANLPIAENSVEFAANLKLGWNLGNTLDANGAEDMTSETSWGQPMVTRELINYIKEVGFTSIRIPVSWGNHTDEAYKIDAEWMKRVTTIVDYALEAGLYVILNSHHDNDFYYPSIENSDKAIHYLSTIWKQIAENFKDYDERLVFETMNEPRLSGTDIEWWFQQTDETGCAAIRTIGFLNQAVVDTIRDGENYNKTRYVMIPSYAASPDFTMHKDFAIASDPANRILISIHAYTPYNFTMNVNGFDTWEGNHDNDLSFISKLKTTFIDKGYGVVIGEFGATNKDNDEARIAWAKDYTSRTASYGIPVFLWDNGGTEVGEENFGMIDRTELKLYYPELFAAYLENYK